jgi:hypothetical protein
LTDLTENALEQTFGDWPESMAVRLQLTTIILNSMLAKSLNVKSFGPYVRHGKQFWRNYHREIKLQDAKTYWEVQYLGVPEVYPKICRDQN